MQDQHRRQLAGRDGRTAIAGADLLHAPLGIGRAWNRDRLAGSFELRSGDVRDRQRGYGGEDHGGCLLMTQGN
jgi:hypothetical protein